MIVNAWANGKVESTSFVPIFQLHNTTKVHVWSPKVKPSAYVRLEEVTPEERKHLKKAGTKKRKK